MVGRPRPPEPLLGVKAGAGSGVRALFESLTGVARERRRQPFDDNVSRVIKSSPVSQRQHIGILKSEDVRLEFLGQRYSRSEITSVGSVRGSGDIVLERPGLL